MSTKTIIFSVVGITVLIVGLAFLLTSGQKPDPAFASYSIKDENRPKVETTQRLFDFGQIKVSDVKEQDFTLKNIGNKPLQILNINSSCNCTFGQVIYKGLKTKEYGMHAQSGYVTDIAPGDSASIRVTYKPAIMPVYGAVEREVYVTTNDPENAKLIFSIKATVK